MKGKVPKKFILKCKGKNHLVKCKWPFFIFNLKSIWNSKIFNWITFHSQQATAPLLCPSARPVNPLAIVSELLTTNSPPPSRNPRHQPNWHQRYPPPPISEV